VNQFFCLACSSNSRAINADGECLCRTGFFDPGASLCLECHHSCGVCVGDLPSACISCSDSIRFIDMGGCYCIVGYYDLNIKQCGTCSIQFCIACSSPTVCLLCMTTSIMNKISLCICPPGQFVSNTACQTCGVACLTCSGQTSNCTICRNDGNREGVPTCNCILGFFDNNSALCVRCPPVCVSCVSLQSCTSCLANTSSLPSCACAATTYVAFGGTCNACNYTCQSCLNSEFCLSCPGTRTLHFTSCVCEPQSFDNGLPACTQVICPANCLICDPTACITCTSNRIFNGQSCLCEPGYIEVSNTCSKCATKCTTCTGST
jgi:proprotein convertase subtilisin/kexin type 5